VACGNVGSPRHACPTSTAECWGAGWKQERVSESKRYGTVNCTSATLLTRKGLRPCGWWGLLIGLSTMINKPAGLLSRTPSLAQVTISELGQAAARSIDGSRCQPARRLTESQPIGVLLPRIVDQAKAQGNAWDTGVVPGCLRTELNSTIAEEVEMFAVDRGVS